MANDWFAGFRHGARMGAEGGYRTLATLHTSFGDESDLGAGEPIAAPLNHGWVGPAVEALPAPAAASPAIQPSTAPRTLQTPPQAPAEFGAPLTPNDLPLEATPPNTEQAAPPIEEFSPTTEQGSGAFNPPTPEVVNPFRTAKAEPVIPAATQVVEMQLKPSVQSPNVIAEDLLPEPLMLPPAAQPEATLTSHELAASEPAEDIITRPLILPTEIPEEAAVTSLEAPLPDAAPAVPQKPLPLPNTEASPVVADEVRQELARKQFSKAELMKLTTLPLEQPAQIQVQSVPQPIAVKRDERSVREKSRAAYFAK